MTRGRLPIASVLVAIAAIGAVAALAYLRDPEWLIRVESGFREWETTADGTRYRWTNGHASFFVRSDAIEVGIPIRTTFAAPSDGPVTMSLAIDDRPADQLVLTDEAWHRVTVGLPPIGGRRVRRIDIRVDRTRSGNRGVQVGEVQVR
jgi:hypothetical protein